MTFVKKECDSPRQGWVAQWQQAWPRPAWTVCGRTSSGPLRHRFLLASDITLVRSPTRRQNARSRPKSRRLLATPEFHASSRSCNEIDELEVRMDSENTRSC